MTTLRAANARPDGPKTAASGWLYLQSETPSENPSHGLYTVGFYRPDGRWEAESDHATPEQAAERVHYLNGGIIR